VLLHFVDAAVAQSTCPATDVIHFLNIFARKFWRKFFADFNSNYLLLTRKK
jgi:hypothetical protein